ncbi:FecCD family ABC transporter permease [Gordonia sp. DT30]|uniref:FecCD family ABC transporter permease n=1 Tax=Gordonia sp. DT30 TaxID=3416546 RepID=UPI003CE8F426
MSSNTADTPVVPARPLRSTTRRIVRLGPTSWVWRPRVLISVTISLVIAFVLFLASVTISDYPVTPIDVMRIILGGGTRIENVVILDDAVPRALVSVLVGFGLGMSGALTQLIAQNPLATPDMLGITAGAGAAAVTAIAFGTSWGAWLADLGVPVAALIGGLGTAAVMYLLAWPGRRGIDSARSLRSRRRSDSARSLRSRRRSDSARSLRSRRRSDHAINPLRLVLIGVGITWVLQAATSYLLTRAEIRDVGRAQTWLVGSVANTSWSSVWPVAAALVPAVVATGVLARQIDVMSLGTDLARSLGVRTMAVSGAVLLIAVVVAALAVSAAGPIAFVALLAPQIAMRLSRTAIPTPVASGSIGAILVVGGDICCRTLLPDGLPVGIVTAAIGGPFLIYLMISISRKATV